MDVVCGIDDTEGSMRETPEHSTRRVGKSAQDAAEGSCDVKTSAGARAPGVRRSTIPCRLLMPGEVSVTMSERGCLGEWVGYGD